MSSYWSANFLDNYLLLPGLFVGKQMRIRRNIAIIFVLAVIVALQLYVLRELDYSTSSIRWLDNGAVTESKPGPNFKIGNISWNVQKYRDSPKLAAFREYFNQHCKGLLGIEAASCLSESFLKRVPFGEPSNEIFMRTFDPAASFNDHLSGRPGHCVTYSFMTVDSLLSVGIPARFIQTLPDRKSGHNIISVWDETYGWVAFDPLSDTLLSDGKNYLSAFKAHKLPGSVKRVEANPDNPTSGYLTDYYVGENPFDGAITFPEPWLYTRIGERQEMFPVFDFVAFGDWRFDLGMFQTILRYGIVICIAGAFLLALNLVRLFAVSARVR